MKQILIVGHLVRDPEQRTTTDGVNMTTFTVAVNTRNKSGETTDYFRVTAWRWLAENCSRFLAKGSKVLVQGNLSAGVYTSQGEARINLDVAADKVEFLTPRERKDTNGPWAGDDVGDAGQFIKVDLGDELPF